MLHSSELVRFVLICSSILIPRCAIMLTIFISDIFLIIMSSIRVCFYLDILVL